MVGGADIRQEYFRETQNGSSERFSRRSRPVALLLSACSMHAEDESLTTLVAGLQEKRGRCMQLALNVAPVPLEGHELGAEQKVTTHKHGDRRPLVGRKQCRDAEEVAKLQALLVELYVQLPSHAAARLSFAARPLACPHNLPTRSSRLACRLASRHRGSLPRVAGSSGCCEHVGIRQLGEDVVFDIGAGHRSGPNHPRLCFGCDMSWRWPRA
jgi:hypothetical protein